MNHRDMLISKAHEQLDETAEMLFSKSTRAERKNKAREARGMKPIPSRAVPDLPKKAHQAEWAVADNQAPRHIENPDYVHRVGAIPDGAPKRGMLRRLPKATPGRLAAAGVLGAGIGGGTAYGVHRSKRAG